MKLPIHSLFFRISLLFAALLILSTAVFGMLALREYERQIHEKRKISFPLMMATYDNFMYDRNLPLFIQRMDEYDFEITEDSQEVARIRRDGKWQKRPIRPLHKETPPEEQPVALIRYHGDIYMAFRHPLLSPYLFRIGEKPELGHLLLAYAVTLFFIILLYLGILNSLRPLKQLRTEINKFANGDMDIQCRSHKKDEIASVANEFQSAVDKIRHLSESRRLFLRNIMHELKTPIHKGKIATSMLEDSKYTTNIIKSFERQERLIEEFSRIEQLSADQIQLDMSPCRLIDLLEYALDLLPESHNIILPECAIRIDADFELLATALKNLIDNGIQYSPNHHVSLECKENILLITNKGNALEHPLESYYDPYLLSGKKQQESRGLGFGLYISLQILKLHKYGIAYTYHSGENRFQIDLSS